MKKNLFLVAMATLFLTSCGSKQIVSTDYQAERASSQQSTQQRPARTMREVDPCILLSEEDSPNMRAVGTATSYVEKDALNEARAGARNELAQMIRVGVEGATQDYQRNANQNLKNSAETLTEQIMTQFVAEKVENTRTIKTTIYDLADGQVQVYVCIEMKIDKENFNKELGNYLEREGVIEVEADRERFIGKIQSEINEYKQKNSSK